METPSYVSGPKIDEYVHGYKHATEVDEYVQSDTNIDNKTERQRAIEKAPGCNFIIVNPDKEDFNIFNFINKLYRQVEQLSKKHSSVKFKRDQSDIAIKSRFIKYTGYI